MVAKRGGSGNSSSVPKATPEQQALLSLVQVQYKNWDVVWSRMAGYPWWPGIVFLDWDVVVAAGVPTPKVLLHVPAPESREVVVTIHGKQETRAVTDHFCLVMFLDKGDWFVANMSTQIMPFTSNYAVNCKPTHKRGKTQPFKTALQRALKLLHLSNEHTEEELALFNTPPQEKRQRVEPKLQPKKKQQQQHVAVSHADSDWEDEYESSEKDDDEDADFEVEKVEKPAKVKSRAGLPRKLEPEFPAQSPASGSSKSRVQSVKKPKQSDAHRQNGAAASAVVVVYDDDDADHKVAMGRIRKKLASKATPVVDDSHTAHADVRAKDAASQKKPSKKKASSKAAHAADAIDESLAFGGITADGGKRGSKQQRQLKAEGKSGVAVGKKVSTTKKKKKAQADASINADEDDDDVEFIENPNLPNSEGDGTGADSIPLQVSTPLSQIWTTHAEEAESEPPSDAKKTLVYRQDFVWDNEVFASNDAVVAEKGEADEAELISPSARDRPLGKRQMRSVQQSHIRQNLMSGNLDPHTMVQCESYRSNDDIENLNSRSRGSSSLEPPFQIQVHPDAVFVCDLHSHLATCEIIGFLGGRWDEGTKTLYIQAAFPCRSLMIDGDDGSTDVEMDPGSEIELREIIQNAQLEVVGWYHSHPAFAPDPSIRDIENQTSYQQLFQRRTERQVEGSEQAVVEISEPFVGLIVGTYDTKRDTPVSLFRYFHTRGEKVSGGARREIFLPFELVPTRRYYRAVLSAERRAEISSFTMYPSVFELLFGRQQSANRLKSVKLPKDNEGDEILAGIDASELPSKQDVTLLASRKRKLSSEVAVVKAEVSMKKVRGKRGRKRKAGSTNSVNGDAGKIDLTGDDAESPASDQPAASPVVAAAAVETEGDNTDAPIDVDAEAVEDSLLPDAAANIDESGDALTSSQITEEPSAAPSVRLRVAPKVNVAELAERSADVTSENTGGDGSIVEVSGTAAVSEGVDAGNGGRRRGRKPVQTQRKSATFLNNSTRDDRSPHNSQNGAVATQIAVYGAFGSASGVTMADKKEIAALQPVKQESISSSGTATTTADSKDYVFLQFSASVKEENRDDPSAQAQGKTEASADEPGSSLVVLSSVDEEPISESQSELPSETQEATAEPRDVVASESDEVIPESQSQPSPAAEVDEALVAEMTTDAKVKAGDEEVVPESQSQPSPAAEVDEAPAAETATNGEVKAERGASALLFGSGRQVEDIRTSLERIRPMVEKMIEARESAAAFKTISAAEPDSNTTVAEAKAADNKGTAAATAAAVDGVTTGDKECEDMYERQQAHLHSLRSKYGAGISGCAEQVITLVDYYRGFERRINLNETWKAKMNKLGKIEASLSEYVRYVNLSVDLREQFVQDVVGYLHLSWELTRPAS